MPDPVLSRNKIVYFGQTLIDLTNDTVDESKVLSNETFHKPDGSIATGACTYDADTSDATASAAEILDTKTAYKNGQKITGSMPNRGAQSSVIAAVNDAVAIQSGYHDGSGTVSIDAIEKAKIIAGNIKKGVQILGVTGNYEGTDQIKAVAGSGTPSASAQTILPSSAGDYDYFTQFTIAAIPYTETQNAAGGLTVTIGS